MYIPDSIQNTSDYKRCVEFHGHTCMGVTIGYLAAQLSMKLLGVVHSIDEELIAVVETDACCCDAIQVLTGCTFGKGNLFYLDYGKMAFTFASRATGKGVRLSLKNEIFSIPDEEQKLAEKIVGGSPTVFEVTAYEKVYEGRGRELFARGPEGFFDVEILDNFIMPDKAPKAASKVCDICGEMVMETKLKTMGAQLVCRGCLE